MECSKNHVFWGVLCTMINIEINLHLVLFRVRFAFSNETNSPQNAPVDYLDNSPQSSPHNLAQNSPQNQAKNSLQSSSHNIKESSPVEVWRKLTTMFTSYPSTKLTSWIFLKTHHNAHLIIWHETHHKVFSLISLLNS